MKSSDFTILVADDDLGLLDVYEKALSAEGYRLILVESCERALAELHEKEASLLITDLKMVNVDKMAVREKLSDMDSFEMFLLLMRNHPKMPVIVVSGSYDGSVEDFEERGFWNVKSFLLKPLAMDDLKRKIREVLDLGEV